MDGHRLIINRFMYIVVLNMYTKNVVALICFDLDHFLRGQICTTFMILPHHFS